MRATTYVVWLAIGVLGCADESGSRDDSGGKNDDGPEDFACGTVLVDKSGRGAVPFAELDDPVANLILKPGTSCPMTFQEVQAKLRETDAEGCDAGERSGIGNHIVSERSQLRFVTDSYRAVVDRTCGGRPGHGLFISVFGIQANPEGSTSFTIPNNAELIGFDEQRQAFNFYTLEDLGEGPRWHFFGSSRDLLQGAGDGAFPDQIRRCANCHVGGGPVMKELDVPWNFWEPVASTPGLRELVDAFPDLGQKLDAPDLEDRVKSGLTAWNPRRVELVRETGTTADLLRPLFCTVEVNLQSSIPGNFGGIVNITQTMVDPRLTTISFGVPRTAYQAALVTADQRILDSGTGEPLLGGDGQLVGDTATPFLVPEPSFADADYVLQLQKAGVVDDDFVKDVLAVDLSRPIFSSSRCGLLELAPALDPAGTDPDAVRNGFIANLEAADPSPGSAAAELLAHLKTPGDRSQHEAKAASLATACRDRLREDPEAFMTDLLRFGSVLRERARELPILEFAESLPVDDLNVDPRTRFDVTTCTLEIAPE